MTQMIVDSLSNWCKEHFFGIVTTKVNDRGKNGVFISLIDEQYPFGSSMTLATIILDGSTLSVTSGNRYDDNGILKKDRISVPVVADLSDPRSFPVIMEELFQIAFDYHRQLYRKAIKAKRKHLKPLLKEMARLLREERRRCRANDYQLDNSELLTTS